MKRMAVLAAMMMAAVIGLQAQQSPSAAAGSNFTRPWHAGLFYQWDRFDGQNLNGGGLRLGRVLFGHFGLEGTLDGSEKKGLTFASLGAANNVQYNSGRLARFGGSAVGYWFTHIGPLRLQAALGPAFERLSYEHVASATYGGVYYGLAESWHAHDGLGFRADEGEEIFWQNGTHRHIWRISIGPSLRF